MGCMYSQSRECMSKCITKLALQIFTNTIFFKLCECVSICFWFKRDRSKYILVKKCCQNWLINESSIHDLGTGACSVIQPLVICWMLTCIPAVTMLMKVLIQTKKIIWLYITVYLIQALVVFTVLSIPCRLNKTSKVIYQQFLVGFHFLPLWIEIRCMNQC